MSLSPNYLRPRTIGAVIRWTLLCAIVVGTVWSLLDWIWGLAALAAGAALAIWRVLRVREWVRTFRYAERADDLLISQGLFLRKLVCVPYGRMQVVKVDSGPLDRRFKLAGVSLVTAASDSNAEIPGLDAEVAAALRDRLIAAGESKAIEL
jgi:membrane protein YdbS with pleckstrin-like domain